MTIGSHFMRNKAKLLNDDEYGIYTIIEIDNNLITPFFESLLRKVFNRDENLATPKHLLKRKRTEKRPSIVSSAVFIDNDYGVAKIVLFFSRMDDFFLVESYVKRLRRRHRLEMNTSYERLIDLANKNPSRFLYIPPSQNFWMNINNNDIMTLWIYTNHKV